MLRTLIRRIARQKRDQAKKSSFVKIKGNDVIATTKIFYSMVYVPILLFAFALGFGLLSKVVLGKSWTEAARSAFTMAWVIPLYLYVCVVFSYDFVKYARNAWSQIKLRLLQQTTMTLSFRDLIREKMEIEGEILAIIRKHKDELHEMLEKRVSRRDLAEEITEDHIDHALANIEY